MDASDICAAILNFGERGKTNWFCQLRAVSVLLHIQWGDFTKVPSRKKGLSRLQPRVWPFKHLARLARVTKKKKQTARSLWNLYQMEHVLHPIIHSLEDSKGFRLNWFCYSIFFSHWTWLKKGAFSLLFSHHSYSIIIITKLYIIVRTQSFY